MAEHPKDACPICGAEKDARARRCASCHLVDYRLDHLFRPPIVNEFWILPRPRKDCYVGSFPLHFEKKLLRLLGIEPAHVGSMFGPRVLHPFGGLCEYGDSVDLNATTAPTWVGDAHDLDWIEDGTYDLVVLDPPYSDEEANWLYSTPPLKPSRFRGEACRVTKPGGYVALYHKKQPKRPADGWTLTHRIVVLTRTGHAPRVCFVYRKPLEVSP